VEGLRSAGRRHDREERLPLTVAHATVRRLAFVWQMRYVGRSVGFQRWQFHAAQLARKLAAGIAGASLVDIPDCARHRAIEKPTAFVASIRSCLEIPL
jgi:hypothetical protein